MTWHVRIENVAGIREGEATIEPGVNAVRASNWRGKSSLIAGIEAAVGTGAPLTEGETAGRVELATDDGDVTVELAREDGTVVRRGGRYLDDARDRRCAELFAFLDDANEVRAAVRRGENLEAVLTDPLDLEDIDEQIAAYRREREQVEAELEQAEAAAAKLSATDERIGELESELEELEDREADLDEPTASGDGGDWEALSDARAERERTRDRVDRLEETVANARETLADRRDELDALEVPEAADVESELAEAREDLRSVERDVELLRSVYEANSRIVEEGRIDLVGDVERGLVEDVVECWVCGNRAEAESFDGRLEALRDRIASLRSEAAGYEETVESLEARRDEVERARRREADLEAAIADLEATLVDREESLAAAGERLAELDETVESLEDAVEERDRERTDVRSERKYVETELDEARQQRESLASRAEQRETLSGELDRLGDEMERLRERKETVQRELRESFSAAMGDIVERFDVGFESARLTGSFDVVVAREGREASLDALSEGELELLGIVAALAGHRAYDVGERLPVILLDGIGGLAGDNLGRLVEYLEGRATYLVLTAYPEHEALEANELDPSRWTVVSDQNGAATT